MKIYLALFVSVYCTAIMTPTVIAQEQIQSQAQWCKTGSDANLDFIRRKVDAMAADIKSMNQINTQRATRIKVLTDNIKSISEEIKAERALHDAAPATTPEEYAAYKIKWLDSGRLNTITHKKVLGKAKLNDLKAFRTSFNQTKAARQALSARYTNIAGEMLDKNRDCSAALNALIN